MRKDKLSDYMPGFMILFGSIMFCLFISDVEPAFFRIISGAGLYLALNGAALLANDLIRDDNPENQ